MRTKWIPKKAFDKITDDEWQWFEVDVICPYDGPCEDEDFITEINLADSKGFMVGFLYEGKRGWSYRSFLEKPVEGEL